MNLQEFIKQNPAAAEGKRNRWHLILLACIAEHPGLTRNEMLEMLSVKENSAKRSSIDTMLKKLADENLVYRERNPDRAYMYQTMEDRQMRLDRLQRFQVKHGRNSNTVVREIWDAMPEQMKHKVA
jgi:predicted transcriptional regulator